jgi:hypothetical protein
MLSSKSQVEGAQTSGRSTAAPPFRDLLALVDLGGYRLPGFPFPWSCWAIASDGAGFGLPGTVVPSLLLQPRTRWAGDTDALDAWAEGTYVGPDEAVLRVPDFVFEADILRYPGPFGLPSSHEAGATTLERCLERVRSGPGGVREVAQAHPWTLLFDPVLSASAHVLAVPIEGVTWPEGSARVLRAALAVSPGRGRPRRAPELDRSLALLSDAGWLRRGTGVIRRTMADIERLLAKSDATLWPRHGSVHAAPGTRYKPALVMTRKRLDEHGAASTLVPFLDDAWEDATRGGWGDAPGGPCADGLWRWIRAPHFGAVLRVVAGLVHEDEHQAGSGSPSAE